MILAATSLDSFVQLITVLIIFVFVLILTYFTTRWMAGIQNLYGISDALIDYIKDKPSGTGLIYNNSVIIPIDYKLPTDSELYHIMSTNPNDEARKTAIKRKANEEFDGEKEDEE